MKVKPTKEYKEQQAKAYFERMREYFRELKPWTNKERVECFDIILNLRDTELRMLLRMRYIQCYSNKRIKELSSYKIGDSGIEKGIKKALIELYDYLPDKWK